MKICTKCKIEKDESEFNKRGKYSDKLLSRCKSCYNKYYLQKYHTDLKFQKRCANSAREHNHKRYNREICEILGRHHKAYQSDPDHLTTEFLQDLIGINCKIKP
jgi:acetyl-CoA carboxylase beta subunit